MNEKKFEEMDEFIEKFDDLADAERCGFFEKEVNLFTNLTENEKIEAYNKLFINAVMNNYHCIKRAKLSLE